MLSGVHDALRQTQHQEHAKNMRHHPLSEESRTDGARQTEPPYAVMQKMTGETFLATFDRKTRYMRKIRSQTGTEGRTFSFLWKSPSFNTISIGKTAQSSSCVLQVTAGDSPAGGARQPAAGRE